METDRKARERAVEALRSAEALYPTGSFQDAKGMLSEVLDIDASLGRAWELKGMLDLLEGDFKGAEHSMQKALPSVGELTEAGTVLSSMASKKWPRGDTPLSSAMRYAMLGQVFLSKGMWPAAAVCLTTLESFAALDWKLCSAMGLIFRQLGRLDDSLEYYSRAAGLPGAPPEVGFDRAVVLFKLGRLKEAEDSFRQLTGSVAEPAPVFNNLGAVLEAEGRLEEALSAYEEAVSADPEYFMGLYSKGLLLQRLGRGDEAKEPLQRALDIEARIWSLDDVEGRRSREEDGLVHVKEVSRKKRTEPSKKKLNLPKY